MHFLDTCAIILWHVRERLHAPIAQLDRVTDYESVGRGFESLSAYHLKSLKLYGFRLFSYFLTEFEIVEFWLWNNFGTETYIGTLWII